MLRNLVYASNKLFPSETLDRYTVNRYYDYGLDSLNRNYRWELKGELSCLVGKRRS